MNIEHWIPRAVDGSQTFVWRNLLGVCSGTYSGPRASRYEIIEHCDKSRRERVLLYHHPADLPLGELYPFRIDLKGPSPYEVGIATETALVAYMAEEGNRLRGWLSSVESPRCIHEQGEPCAECAWADIEELNLNALRLVNDRATVIARLRQQLALSGSEKTFIRDRLRAAQASKGRLPSFAHIELAYLRHKARAHGLK